MTSDNRAVARWENEGGTCLNIADDPVLGFNDKGRNNISNLENKQLPTGNRILASLSSGDRSRLSSKLKEVSLVFGETIYEEGDAISDVYFPNSGIISLLAVIDDQSTMEVGIIGREGIVGLQVFLGVGSSKNRTIVQGAGLAMKLSTDDFLEACQEGIELRRLLRRFAYSLFTQVAQSAACCRFHPIDARLSRWLLMTSDRMGSNEFQITQEFLSNMLGVRREAVNRAAVDLQKRDLITYSRGTLLILNRVLLTETACICYGVITKEELGG